MKKVFRIAAALAAAIVCSAFAIGVASCSNSSDSPAVLPTAPESAPTTPTTPESALAKKAGSIGYACASLSKTTFDAPFINPLTKIGNGVVVYSSSALDVAIVDIFGQVIITGEGTATITATVFDSDTYSYDVKTASYSISVAIVPLTLEALADGTITLKNPPSTLKYKKNDGKFETVTASGDPAQATIAVAMGDKVSFLANGTGNIAKGENPKYYFNIDCSADCYLYGNVMSLDNSNIFYNCVTVSADNEFYRLFYGNKHIKNHYKFPILLPATELTKSCYREMFFECEGLTAAPTLPAVKLKNECYKCMFEWCKKLAQAPELPATELANECYSFMFYGCSSLEKAPALPVVKLTERCYESMFARCESLAKAPDLPATELTAHCYSSMFSLCVKITSAPTLPATKLANYCYQSMFSYCKALTQAPELPAETLAKYCYEGMFMECSSLQAAPVLKAKTLVEGCYTAMFGGCSNLSYIKCLATDISAASCLDYWLKYVALNGTFVKDKNMSGWKWSTSKYDGIPNGWTVQDAE